MGKLLAAVAHSADAAMPVRRIAAQDLRRQSRARTSLALTLSIAVHVLLILLLIQAGRVRQQPDPKPRASSVELFEVPPEAVPLHPIKEPEPKPAPQTQPSVSSGAPAPQASPVPDPELPPPPSLPAVSAPAPVIPLPAPPAPAASAAAGGAVQGNPSGSATAGSGTASGTGAGADDGDGVLITNAQWIRRPTSDDWAVAYPSKAIGFRGTAHVSLSCRVSRSNRVQYCRVVKETPRGLGLGLAAIKMSGKFRVRPVVVAGEPRYDIRVRIPLVLASPGSGR